MPIEAHQKNLILLLGADDFLHRHTSPTLRTLRKLEELAQKKKTDEEARGPDSGGGLSPPVPPPPLPGLTTKHLLDFYANPAATASVVAVVPTFF